VISELLQNYRTAIIKRQEAEVDLNLQLKGQMTPEMKTKRRECKEAEEELKKIETRLGECIELQLVYNGFFFKLVCGLLQVFASD
jgi:transposase